MSERLHACLKCAKDPRMPSHHVCPSCHCPERCHICNPHLRHVYVPEHDGAGTLRRVPGVQNEEAA